MLKKRLIPVELLLEGRLVKSRQFSSFRDVGDPVKSSQVYSDQYADELIFLNIDRLQRGIEPLRRFIRAVSEVVFMPLTVGGGVATPKDAQVLFEEGADKVSVNSAAYSNLSVISEISGHYGTQAVVAAIDVLWDGQTWVCYSNCGREKQQVSLSDHLSSVVSAGAGEVLIQSIDRDGQMQGYDTDLLAYARTIVTVPIIGAGGAGNYEHLSEAFEAAGVDALAMGSLFNFGDNNPIRAKAHLTHRGIPCKRV